MISEVEQPAPGAFKRYSQKMKLMSIAAKMTKAGWLVDRDRIRVHRKDALERAEKFTQLFCQHSGLDRRALGPSGIGNTQTIRDFFFCEMQAPVVARSKRKKKPQCNSATLVEWATKDRKAAYAASAAAIYAIRKNRKLTDFCETYLKFSENDGRIHFEYNPLGTQTGRWTSSTRRRERIEGINGKITRKKISCNAQQVPKKEMFFDFGDGQNEQQLSVSLRDCFLPDPGCVLLRADYDQLELRLIAYVYGVQKLIEALDRGTDIHLLTASALFKELGITTDSDKSIAHVKNAREAAKGCAYGMSYQMSFKNKVGRYPTLFKSLKERFPRMNENQVAVLVQRFFEIYPEIQAGQQQVKDRIDRYGFQELAINGRRLYYPATNPGYNAALNFPMQGTGGVLCDNGIIELDPQLNWEEGEQLRGQIHDEIVVQAPVSEARRVAGLINQAMSRPSQIGATFIGIPAEADPGLDWGSCMKFKEFEKLHPNLLS